MLKYVMTRVPGSCAVFMAVFLVISPAIAADLPEAIPDDPNRDALYARLEAAAEAGDPLAQYQFAELNENWKAGYHNYSKTLHWYKQSAENGNVLAQFRLGYMYRRRVSVDTDFSGAVKWYTMAAAQVHVGAMEALGLMYDHARGFLRTPGL